MEINQHRIIFNKLTLEKDNIIKGLKSWVSLLSADFFWEDFIELKEISIFKKSIAGIELTFFEKIEIAKRNCDFMICPLWVSDIIETFEKLFKLEAEIRYLEIAQSLLEEELRITAQRVNLFKEIKIPESESIIKKIRIFLGDQQTAAIGRAKLAKRKIFMKEARVGIL